MKIAFAPNGKLIVGTLETIQATASIHGVAVNRDGNLEPEYTGDTIVDWNSQITVRNNRKMRLFVDEDGCSWSEAKLVLKDEPQLVS